jgi:hypothetical protein
MTTNKKTHFTQLLPVRTIIVSEGQTVEEAARLQKIEEYEELAAAFPRVVPKVDDGTHSIFD